MTIASLLLALVVTTAADPTPASAGGEPVLLDFHSAGCNPCQRMRPEIARLVGMQYPIRSVDVGRNPEVAERFGVRVVPTFVVVDASGQVLDRREGFMPAAELAAFYNRGVGRLNQSQSTRPAEARAEGPDEDAPDDNADAETEGREPAPVQRPVNPRPWETVVRIKIHLTRESWAYGSGTIIYSDANESIILTCAHIFKDKDQRRTPVAQFRTPIGIDLFDGKIRFVDPSRRDQPGQLACLQSDLPGEVIDYDFDNDVGLIRIQPGRRLPASRVVPVEWQPQRGMEMFSVGCSRGNDATAWNTRIIDPSVQMQNTESGRSFTEIRCTNMPSQGRSGGGLYTADGYVAGVCDFADPNDHNGLYASPKAIYRLLDRANLATLYRGDPNRLLASATRGGKTRGPGSGTIARGQSPEGEADQPVVASHSFTLPPPQLVGIESPDARPASRASRGNQWQAPALVANSGRTRRSAGTNSPDRPAARDLDGASGVLGGRATGPIPSGAAVNPDDGPTGDTEGQPLPEPVSKPQRPVPMGKWRPVPNPSR